MGELTSPDKLRQTEQDQRVTWWEPTSRMIDLILDQATSLPERNGSLEAETNSHQQYLARLETLAERITVFMERAGNWFAGVQVNGFDDAKTKMVFMATEGS